ncbi:hypothetical protein [Williamsia deligens]|uniref:Tocopherol cyclase n=1 Tax=Williamsia deligens TaxID=321325 RepID=A0ABW3G6J6_9NOCA|nr:hypothetical protein [Williamsia deligens]MCP2194872.1 hypothetical protein [Williamsia deligens]
MIGPADEYPVHQAPLPIALPATTDRNFYDRCYVNAHDSSGDIFVVMGLGHYPVLGVSDAFVLIHRGDDQTAVHLSGALIPDRLDQSVGAFRLDVVEPLRSVRLRLAETEGIALDATFTGSFDVVEEQRHILRAGSRTTLDAQRFAQVGTWTGALEIDGERIEFDPTSWVGTRDRSWGIRPIGEAEPAGRPADPPFEGMWWMYLPLAFDDFGLVMVIQEEPDGTRTLDDAVRIWADGRREQLRSPEIAVTYGATARVPESATVTTRSATGEDIHIEVTSLLATALHVGGGYGGDPDWNHGQWRGEGFTERVRYDVADPAVAGRIPFGVSDHVPSATWTEAGVTRRGVGMFEHACLGRHDPSGFSGWF